MIDHAPRERGTAARFYTEWFDAKRHVELHLGLPLPADVRLEVFADQEGVAGRAQALGTRWPPEWIAGLAIPSRGTILVRADLQGPVVQRVDQLLRHEMVHIAMGTLRVERPDFRVPLWFEEGVAQIIEGRVLIQERNLLPRARIFGNLPALAQFAPGFPRGESEARVAYAASASFLRYLMDYSARYAGRESMDLLPALVGQVRAGASLDEAILMELGRPRAKLEADWRASLMQRPGSWLELIMEGLLGAGMLLLIWLGIGRIVRRRRRAAERWEAEERAAAMQAELALDGEWEEGPRERGLAD